MTHYHTDIIDLPLQLDTSEGDETSLWDVVLRGNVLRTVETPKTHTIEEIKRKLVFSGYDENIGVFAYPYEV